MKNTKRIVKSAIKSVLALTAVSTIFSTTNAFAEQETEKCYGVVKAGMNDCETSNQSCAGSALKDGQPDAFVFMPKGLCEKIVGGSLKPITKTETK
ncbi:MAG: DUF2282 domain-containing protein [Candidatus Berkiella sp.]